MRNDEEEKIVEFLLELLLDNRQFFELWEERTESAIARQRKDSQEESDNYQEIVPNEPNPSSNNKDQLIIQAQQLLTAIETAIEFFQLKIDISLCYCEPEHNRDAGDIFAARLQIHRIFETSDPESSCESACRRLCQLLRTFVTRISSPFQIANCSMFASTLCELLYKVDDAFEELRPESNLDKQLRVSIDNFNLIVVASLSKHLNALRSHLRSLKKDSLRFPAAQFAFSTPQPQRRRALQRLQPSTTFCFSPFRQKGYLLEPKLEYERARLAAARSASLPNKSIRRISSRESKEHSNRLKEITNRQSPKKIDTLTKIPPLLETDNDNLEFAKRVSREIMREIGSSRFVVLKNS